MKNCILILAAFLSLNIYAQTGKGEMFPSLTGESFDGKVVNIPDQTKGKITIVGVCFSKAAEDQLKTWLNPVYNMFVVKKDTNDFFSAAVNYDVHFYFVPMLNQILEKSSKKQIKEGTDKEFWPYLVFYTGETKLYQNKFNLHDKESPYFFVLDKNGKVLHIESGKYSDKKMDKIEEFLD
jgi:hypothetical protein